MAIPSPTEQVVADVSVPARRPPLPPSTIQATARTRARYDRLAPLFDRMEAGIEATRFGPWRAALWEDRKSVV